LFIFSKNQLFLDAGQEYKYTHFNSQNGSGSTSLTTSNTVHSAEAYPQTRNPQHQKKSRAKPGQFFPHTTKNKERYVKEQQGHKAIKEQRRAKVGAKSNLAKVNNYESAVQCKNFIRSSHMLQCLNCG